MENLRNRSCVTGLNPYFTPEWGWENLILQRWIHIHLLICPSSKVKSTESFLSQQQPSLWSCWSGHQSLIEDIWLVDFPQREWRFVFEEYLTRTGQVVKAIVRINQVYSIYIYQLYVCTRKKVFNLCLQHIRVI